ncbi:MAG: polysaccharide deacetylase family protein [Candidatus Rokuibacteriota bacterium]
MRIAVRGALYRTFFSIHRPGRSVRMILLYHSVGSASPLAESVETFRTQMRYVARWFRVVRVSEFLGAAAADPGGNLAAVTFDDGFADNATIARSILEEVGVPGTFFVVTGLLGAAMRTSAGPFTLMAPTQVKALATAGHEVGAHSVTHVPLTELPTPQARREVVDSRRYLEDLLGRPVTSFSYPKGRLNHQVQQFVQEAGYRQAVGSRPRGFADAPVDPFALPRMAIRDYVRLAGRRPRV